MRRKNKSNNFIYKNFKLSLKYLGKTRNYFFFLLILFFLTALVGYFYPHFFQKKILKMIEEIIKNTQGLGVWELISFIINNNIWSAFSGFIFGIFLGFAPLLIIIINGYVLGFIANKVVSMEGITILWRLFPHGIFELPAIIISASLGLKLGMFPFYIKEKLRGVLAFFVFLILGIFSLGFIISILLLLANPDVMNAKNPDVIENFYNALLENPITKIIFLGIVFLCFIISLYVGLKIMSNNDRKIIMENIKNSLRVFVFVVIPLLVIAGIIEGILILVVG